MNSFNQSFKPQKPSDKGTDEKREKINRIIYISAIALLLAVVIIAAVVSAANRAKKEPIETTPQTQPNETPEDKPTEPDTTPEPPEDKPTNESPTEDVSTKLPDFLLPTDGALSVKHDAELQVFSPTMEDYRVHLGIDINTASGAPVCAVAAGTVTKVWEDVRMGVCVAVSHNGGAVSYYKNLDKTLAEGVKEGAKVSAGQLLGAVGESAMVEVAQEPHLHFELTVSGLQVDPLEYFSEDELASLQVDAPVNE